MDQGDAIALDYVLEDTGQIPMPDLSKMQNVVSAMQGVMSSGGSAFESMQKVMGDFASMTSGRR